MFIQNYTKKGSFLNPINRIITYVKSQIKCLPVLSPVWIIMIELDFLILIDSLFVWNQQVIFFSSKFTTSIRYEASVFTWFVLFDRSEMKGKVQAWEPFNSVSDKFGILCKLTSNSRDHIKLIPLSEKIEVIVILAASIRREVQQRRSSTRSSRKITMAPLAAARRSMCDLGSHLKLEGISCMLVFGEGGNPRSREENQNKLNPLMASGPGIEGRRALSPLRHPSGYKSY